MQPHVLDARFPVEKHCSYESLIHNKTRGVCLVVRLIPTLVSHNVGTNANRAQSGLAHMQEVVNVTQ